MTTRAPFPRQLHPDRCEVHADEPTPPPCGWCDVRKAGVGRVRLVLVSGTDRRMGESA